MLRAYDATARYVNQGVSKLLKRPGAFTIYIEIWHADIFKFPDLRKNHGKRKLVLAISFYALWISDLLYVTPVHLQSHTKQSL